MNPTPITIAADQAREIICREFASMIRGGASTVRVRITNGNGAPREAWFYAHRNDGWHKAPGGITDPELIAALEETLGMLASRRHGDDWSARERALTGGHDTELRFHRDRFEGHSGDQLGSLLAGLLFRDSHDSKKDLRHPTQSPRRPN